MFRTTHRIAAAAVAIPLVVGLAACSGERPRPSESTSKLDLEMVTTTPAASGPIDHFTWNLTSGEPASLDWIYAYSDSENTALANMCESLMLQGPDFSLEPGLAEKVDRPDETTMVFTIRDGVTFWDGSPLTADDVVFSLERNLDDAAASYWGVPFYDRVSSIEKTGDLEVTVKFTEPDSLFERILATAAGVIGSKDYVEQAGDTYGTATGGIMCTGPFEFDTWKPGTSITMKRYADYWNADRAALADSATLTFVTDESTIASSLLSGDIDGTYRVPLSATEPLMNSDSGSFYLGASTDWTAVRPTEKDGPFQNPDVRRALSLAYDRAALADTVYRGTATASLSPIQPGAWGYSKEVWQQGADALPSPDQDLDAAKKLVEEHGLAGESITVALPAETESDNKAAELLVAAGKAIGIDVQTSTLPVTSFNALYFDAAARAEYDAFIVNEYGAGVADPIVSLSEFTPLSAYDYGLLDEPSVTDNVAAGFGEIDDDARANSLVEAQAGLVESMGLINLVNPGMRMYMGDRISGATASLAFLYYPWAAGIGAK
ncbi:ABC transporter substrate-binding protein [Agromyces endophyticus]|uniref:ABC transporter substrate-binding protein n=1 Tax=Agromyces sp. H17E-10 TaxID=2932244 RepID=UPI001FD3CF7C|nr:ABC transporter substrate-binding protein [Agromyces sp. H17E-10]UOQ87607.1 ABC transporter substrate-binding protein [Agromyces sp. H17E-10]